MYNIVQIVQEVQETLEFAAGKNHLRKVFGRTSGKPTLFIPYLTSPMHKIQLSSGFDSTNPMQEKIH
jgi:hypothetical protein